MSTRTTIKRALLRAGVASAIALTASLAAYADDAQSGRHDGWQFGTQGPFGFSSGGAPGSFYFHATPGTAFESSNGTRGFVDYSMTHGLSFGRELGIGNTQATFGVRVAEPLISNGFTPAFDDRRYTGAGPRVGLQGSNRLQSSWGLEWQVGAAVLFSDKMLDTANVNAAIPNYAASGGSVLNVDGLLGLSYWFNAASKLTLGYRADAYFNKSAPALNFTTPAQTIDHGPMIKFTIQK
jgi:Legionella pneumophila major outer membrane protein precursor